MDIVFSDKSKSQLKKLNFRFQEKILNILEKFEKNQKVDIKKLKGREEEYRIRVGNYRIILNKVGKEEFLVTKIAKRENIYFIFI